MGKRLPGALQKDSFSERNQLTDGLSYIAGQLGTHAPAGRAAATSDAGGDVEHRFQPVAEP